jgi:hypothetical protein
MGYSSDRWTPPTNEKWSRLANPYLVSVRLAWLTLRKSKDELVATAAQLGDQAVMKLVSQIGRSRTCSKGCTGSWLARRPGSCALMRC